MNEPLSPEESARIAIKEVRSAMSELIEGTWDDHAVAHALSHLNFALIWLGPFEDAS